MCSVETYSSLKFSRFLERALQHIVQSASHILLREAGHFRQLAHLALDLLRFSVSAADSQSRQQRRHHAVRLRHQRGQQMHRLDLLIFVARRNFLRASATLPAP